MSARRSRNRNPRMLIIALAGIVLITLMLAHAAWLIILAAIPVAYGIGHKHGRAGSGTQAKAVSSLSQQKIINGLRADLDKAQERIRAAEESAQLAWDAAAEAEPAKPCPECGSRLAYSHNDGCTRGSARAETAYDGRCGRADCFINGPHAHPQPRNRAALLSDSLSGVRPLGNGE